MPPTVAGGSHSTKLPLPLPSLLFRLLLLLLTAQNVTVREGRAVLCVRVHAETMGTFSSAERHESISSLGESES